MVTIVELCNRRAADVPLRAQMPMADVPIFPLRNVPICPIQVPKNPRGRITKLAGKISLIALVVFGINFFN